MIVVVAAILGVLLTVGLPGQIASGFANTVNGLFGGHTASAHPVAGTGSGAAGGVGSGAPGAARGPVLATTSATPVGVTGSVNAAAAVPSPTPGPTPGGSGGSALAPGSWHWPSSAGNHADQLPTGGDRAYVPPKSGRGNPVRVRGGGYEDSDGNIWEWAPPGQQHGGPHWDVQHPDGSHTNVAPDGTVIGDDNFPNKARVPKPPKTAVPNEPTPSPAPGPAPNPDPKPASGGDGGGSGSGVKKAVAVAGGAAAAGGVAWWLGKIASPACGPAVVVCAVIF